MKERVIKEIAKHLEKEFGVRVGWKHHWIEDEEELDQDRYELVVAEGKRGVVLMDLVISVDENGYANVEVERNVVVDEIWKRLQELGL